MSGSATLSRDIHKANAWEGDVSAFPCPIDLPAGIALRPVLDGLGNLHFAVASARAVATLTGNRHDATHRYVYVPDDAVALPTLEQAKRSAEAATLRFHDAQLSLGRARGRYVRAAREAFHAAADAHAAAWMLVRHIEAQETRS